MEALEKELRELILDGFFLLNECENKESKFSCSLKSEKYSKGGTNVHLITNKVTGETEGKAVYEKMLSVVKKFLGGDLDYLGYIFHDPQLEKAVRNQKVVSLEYPQSKAAKNYETLALRLLQKDDKTHYRWGVSHIFNTLLRDRA